MKFNFLIINFLLLGCFVIKPDLSEGNEASYSELAKFFERYRCSEDVEEAVANNSPEYFVKHDISRIINAKRLENYFKQNEDKVSLIGVAEKCLGKNLAVVAKRVHPHRKEKLNFSWERDKREYVLDASLDLRYTSQFNQFVEDTEFGDVHDGNFILDKQGRIIAIDTEDRSFGRFMFDPKKLNKDGDSDINFEQVQREWYRTQVFKSEFAKFKKVQKSLINFKKNQKDLDNLQEIQDMYQTLFWY